jgi:hypothetical protein
MKGIKLVALIAGALLGLLIWSQVSAQEQTLSIESKSVAAGGSTTVALEANDIAEPGLAAWSIDVFFDPDIIVATDCTPKSGSVCNPNYAENTVRVTGASAAGLEGDSELAEISFTCASQGTSALTLDALDFADGTVGAPQQIDFSIVNGSILCQTTSTQPTDPAATATVEPTAEAPEIVDAGTGPGDLGTSNWSLATAGLIGAGVAWLIVAGAAAGLRAAPAAIQPWRRSDAPKDDVPRWLRMTRRR